MTLSYVISGFAVGLLVGEERHRPAGLLEPHPEEDVERAEDDDDEDRL